MGNELSFQSFPAHVHNLVGTKLAESHVVHTKIYPRYKSREAIEFARDDFSDWLKPHESPETDIILLGHSMGGLLGAEVALLPPKDSNSQFQHRIMGTVGFETPFLGVHPRIAISGIGSLFRPAPAPSSPRFGDQPCAYQVKKTPPTHSNVSTTSLPPADAIMTENSDSATSQQFTPSGSPTNDPNFNPPYPNDVHKPTRSGWHNAMHFVNKHWGGVTGAARSYVTSHMEFGKCLADYAGLKDRYVKIRAMEDDRRNRIRFVNYYACSTGRIKKEKNKPVSDAVKEEQAAVSDESNPSERRL
ncbi:MAG: hypothetical protein Q9190_004500, partial [Brigantiaea leucoxantha]